ncbi:MAG: NYN domain-containing protein [Dissulfurispiraceae bacterium]
MDGYNVIGIYHKDMEKARAGLVNVLSGFQMTKDHDITVVFDGYKNGMATEQVTFSGNVKVIYTRLGERADDVIKKTVANERREWIVVTADRDIVDHAWAAGSVPVLPERFMDIVTRYCVNGKDEARENEDDSEGRQNRRGNPHQLSKKEKASRRVLSKL